jgi:L-asparaginase
MTQPRVAVVSLGGTISMAKKVDTGVVPNLDAESLVSSLPELRDIADIKTVAFRMVASSGLTLADLLALREEIDKLLQEEIDAVVVTQGTDTIEETSFLLNLTVVSEKPVVVTGAMRDPTNSGSDGQANLIAAVRVCASGLTRGIGTVVVMNDDIHHSRYVKKIHTSNLAAFSSFPLGPIGWISEDRVRIALKPVAERLRITVDPRIPEKEVMLFTALLGDSGKLIRHVAELGYDGVVLEAMGAGHIYPSAVDILGTLASEIPVVLASRTRNGEILSKTYSFHGSESDLLKRGLISARSLNPLKARILLYLLLRAGKRKDEIRNVFENWF